MSTAARVIYADPRNKFDGWSALAHADGTWVVFDEHSNVKHRGTSKDQNKAAGDAIRWMRKKGKMS